VSEMIINNSTLVVMQQDKKENLDLDFR
jgi:hypothetical protein